MSIAELELLVHPESDPARMTFNEFYATYCTLDSDVKQYRDDQLVDFHKILFYGQSGDQIIIQRGGVHQDQLVRWMATYDLQTGTPTFYEGTYMYYSLDPAINSTYADPRIINHVATPIDNPSEIVRLRMGSHVLEWVQNEEATPARELWLPYQ